MACQSKRPPRWKRSGRGEWDDEFRRSGTSRLEADVAFHTGRDGRVVAHFLEGLVISHDGGVLGTTEPIDQVGRNLHSAGQAIRDRGFGDGEAEVFPAINIVRADDWRGDTGRRIRSAAKHGLNQAGRTCGGTCGIILGRAVANEVNIEATGFRITGTDVQFGQQFVTFLRGEGHLKGGAFTRCQGGRSDGFDVEARLVRTGLGDLKLPDDRRAGVKDAEGFGLAGLINGFVAEIDRILAILEFVVGWLADNDLQERQGHFLRRQSQTDFHFHHCSESGYWPP